VSLRTCNAHRRWCKCDPECDYHIPVAFFGPKCVQVVKSPSHGNLACDPPHPPHNHRQRPRRPRHSPSTISAPRRPSPPASPPAPGRPALELLVLRLHPCERLTDPLQAPVRLGRPSSQAVFSSVILVTPLRGDRAPKRKNLTVMVTQ